MSAIRLTHIGGPTLLIEVGGWRLLSDPTFDPPGGTYSFGWGTSSRKIAGPAIAPDLVGAIDAVLLSHEKHGDNLDAAGREVMAGARSVVTTRLAARQLGGEAIGVGPWDTTRLEQDGRPTLKVTATPCRHGPPLLARVAVGEVAGFALEWDGQEHGALWLSGDTVLYDGVREVPERIDVGTAVLHLGAVRFSITGPLRYTLNANEAVELSRLLRPATVIPIHYDGWSHFSEGREPVERAFAAAGNVPKPTWLERGRAAEIET